MEELINTFLGPLLFGLLGLLGSYLSVKLNAYIVAKTGVQTTINLEKAAEQVARTVEEYALVKVKGNAKLTSDEKLQLALKFINQMVPDLDEARAKALVLAAVNKLRCK